MDFQLQAPYTPAGDQPKAIDALVSGLEQGASFQTLLGVTGSGKTFTMANVIQKTQRPTLVIAHNKTLAAQLCHEFRSFFPNNAVEYFVSYYDYYQPEAYLPTSDTYIEKEAMINQEIDRLRHAATQAVRTRRDVIIVSSVSCIYALGSPEEYERTVLLLRVGDLLSREDALRRLIGMQYTRTNADITRGTFRLRGEIMELMPVEEQVLYRVTWEGERILRIAVLDPVSRALKEERPQVWVFPAKHYVASPERQESALAAIRTELQDRLQQFEKEGKLLEAERLSRRTTYDLTMLREVGYCNGIENYSRHFDGRAPGMPPYTLLDYFPKDFLTMIDESHVTFPQIEGMYHGDRARKQTLIEHGFRLPSAKDNRPLTFEEFSERIGQVICTSATPGPLERMKSTQIVEQIIRPTGLVDPLLEMRPVTGNGKDILGQVEDVIEEIVPRASRGERVLITTLTKKMAEELTTFLRERSIKVQYLHSDVDTLDRITILSDFRKGVYDVLVGVNLLREGLDLPEVTLVAILDADKEGFLRSETSMIQTIGRAARNVEGKVLLYADHLTGSLTRAMNETDRRRQIQVAYNTEHGIIPRTILKEVHDIRKDLGGGEESDIREVLKIEMTVDSRDLHEVIAEKEGEMRKAAKKLDFETAALLRDEIEVLKGELQKTNL